jgi:hypothetical protein
VQSYQPVSIYRRVQYLQETRLASTRERSDGADTQPRPELNPLLNPILTDNMGRWAEVYFTSPPERREEAITELLHELEQEREGEKEKAETHPVEPGKILTNLVRHARLEPERVGEEQSGLRFCGTCGSKNPVTHQFCGMCGAKFQQGSSLPESARSDVGDSAPLRIRFAQERAPERLKPEESYEQEPYVEAPFHAPVAGSDELSLFQSFRSPDADEDWDYEPPPSTPYRFYIAAVLLIVIGALGYMAWRSSQASQRSHEASPPPPAPVTESAQPAALPQQASSAPQPTAPPEQAAPPQQTAPQKTAPEAASPTPTSAKTVSSPKNRAATRELAERTPPSAPAQQAASQAALSSGGTEELAMAERYLNGSGGQSRNSSEAATWLWKALAKHNGQAAILLADLYLRGDGVSKNCDQGRVLLDSAARRGIPGAGERLRSLQAFGCH